MRLAASAWFQSPKGATFNSPGRSSNAEPWVNEPEKHLQKAPTGRDKTLPGIRRTRIREGQATPPALDVNSRQALWAKDNSPTIHRGVGRSRSRSFLGPKLRLGPQLRDAQLRLDGTSSNLHNAKRSFEKARAQAELGNEEKSSFVPDGTFSEPAARSP